jgi:hypothetical protein
MVFAKPMLQSKKTHVVLVGAQGAIHLERLQSLKWKIWVAELRVDVLSGEGSEERIGGEAATFVVTVAGEVHCSEFFWVWLGHRHDASTRPRAEAKGRQSQG